MASAGAGSDAVGRMDRGRAPAAGRGCRIGAGLAGTDGAGLAAAAGAGALALPGICQPCALSGMHDVCTGLAGPKFWLPDQFFDGSGRRIGTAGAKYAFMGQAFALRAA